MTQRLDRKTKEILDSKDLDLRDFSVELSLKQDGYGGVNDEHMYVNVSFYYHPDSDEEIGSTSFVLYDANNVHISDIRDIADAYSFDRYQAVSSVRIYPCREEAEFDAMEGFMFDEESNTSWLKLQEISRETGIHISPYAKGFEQGTFEGRPYSKKTSSVWGRILVLNEISIQEEYRTNAIISSLFRSMLLAFKNIGLDSLIINPNINEEYMEKGNYPFTTQKQYNAFLSKQEFTKTYGRLHDKQFCWYMDLQSIE
ncbi:hypothetical protein [Bacillus bombysepticus]|uniref:hypothetical protein n=1 Tax=Bacillus bombysepticus TaxID=658666 RepID=UPI003018D0DF